MGEVKLKGKDALAKAEHNRIAARTCIERLRGTQEGYEALLFWESFVSSWVKAVKNFGAVLEATGGKHLKDNLFEEQKRDKVLAYLYASKNTDFHGAEFVAGFREPTHIIGTELQPQLNRLPTRPSAPISMFNNTVVTIGLNGWIIRERLPDVWIDPHKAEPEVKMYPESKFKSVPGFIKLNPVTKDRDPRVRVDPPTLAPPEENALAVANYGLDWLDIVSRAAKKAFEG